MQKDVILSKLSSNTLNVDDFDRRDAFTDAIIENMVEENLIGQGAVGKVYSFGQYVVKQITPCMAKENSPLQRYCLDITALEEGVINGIPGGNHKYRYILPNLLSEITIGILINDLGFTETISSMILQEEDQVSIYIVMEQLEPFIINHLINPKLKFSKKELLFMLFQVSHTLLTAQTQYRFTHYDLHIENLLWSCCDRISYPLPNQHMRILMQSPFVVKISDFALARMETETSIITPSVEDFPVKTYGEFNPNYDFACFLGSILIDNKYRVAFDELFKNKNLYQLILQLTLWYFNDDMIVDIDNLIFTRDYIANQYYKPIKKKFSFRPKQEGDFIPYTNTKSMVEVVNHLAKLLILNQYVTPHDHNSIVIKDLGYYRSYDPIVLYNPIFKNKPLKNNIVYDIQSQQIDNNITVSKYFVQINEPFKPYNLTIEPIQLETCPLQKQYFTAIQIDNTTNYTFKYDCCKLDGPNYMVENNKVGFCINGGFFSCKKDYLPIGPYQDIDNLIDKYPIPSAYKKDYRFIILKNNQLSINKIVNINDQYCVSGPLLIDQGNIIYKPTNQYSCTDMKHAKELMVEQDEEVITIIGTYDCDGKLIPDLKTFPRCDRIEPGILTHSNNVNPRSVLCILPDSYVFISFEGRGKNGYGVDLLLLSQLILKFYPNTISAINLDGGRSSNLAWRTKDENVVYTSNPDRQYAYSSGNIIGLFKND